MEELLSVPLPPRLLDANVLINTVAEGTKDTDFFGYAKGKEGEKYLGLLFGRIGTVYDDGFIVEASSAAAQVATEEESRKPVVTVTSGIATPPASAAVPLRPQSEHRLLQALLQKRVQTVFTAE